MDLGEENGIAANNNNNSRDTKKKMDPETKELIIYMSVAVVVLALMGYLVNRFFFDVLDSCCEEGSEDSPMRAEGNRGLGRGLSGGW